MQLYQNILIVQKYKIFNKNIFETVKTNEMLKVQTIKKLPAIQYHYRISRNFGGTNIWHFV